MKKMSEIFDLPVNVPVGNDDGLHDDCGGLIAEFPSRIAAKHTAHAINHVDALANALDELLSMLESEGRQGEKIFKDCEQVSNAYWGIK